MFDLLLLILEWTGLIAYYTVSSIFWTWVLWVFYLAVMHLQEARDAGRIPKFAYPPAVATLTVGLVLDFVINVLPLSIAFLEFPKERTVTARLKRHKYDTDWRGKVARWVAAQLLDPFDPSGRHV